MTNALFASMRGQLAPSEAAQAALRARLEAEPVPNKKRSWKPLALAACAALALCAYPAYKAWKPATLHSYVTVEGGEQSSIEKLADPLTEPQEDRGEETGDEAPNLGVADDPAPDVPVQLGADAYQLLMDHFGGTRPDWYGGAYVDETGALTVLLVEGQDPGDKSLELEVLDAVGDLPVNFTSAKYSRNHLEGLNDGLLAVLDGSGIPASVGIYDDQNRIVLDVHEPLPDDLLAAIADLDPEGDAILIRVVEGSPVTEMQGKGPAIEPGGRENIPELHDLPGIVE